MQGAREPLHDNRIELGDELTFDSPAPSPLLPGVLQFLPFKRPPPQRVVFLEPTSTTASNEFSVSRLPHLFYTVVLWLLPRFACRNGLQSTKKEHVTSYLDSLRGWAAVIVLSHHHHPWYVSFPKLKCRWEKWQLESRLGSLCKSSRFPYFLLLLPIWTVLTSW